MEKQIILLANLLTSDLEKKIKLWFILLAKIINSLELEFKGPIPMPTTDPLLSCFNVMFLSMQCDVIVLLCESTHWSVLNMVDKYTFMEMADTHVMFGSAYGDQVEASHLYQNTSPSCQIPDRKTFSIVLIMDYGWSAWLHCSNKMSRDFSQETSSTWVEVI